LGRVYKLIPPTCMGVSRFSAYRKAASDNSILRILALSYFAQCGNKACWEQPEQLVASV
jgi:hypothetical protein